MDFARKQLEKYGWKDGDGLGKECQGMAIALKPCLKTGKEGMGFDLCKDLTDTWWTKAYSDCLSRIDVTISPQAEIVGVSIRQDQTEKDAVSVVQKYKKKSKKNIKDEETKMKNSSLYCSGLEERPIEKMRKRMTKANFTSFSKGGTLLTNGDLVAERDNDMDSFCINEAAAVKILSDEELLKACGGRTAHKAARFGLKLNGKLARLAAQDAISSSTISKNSECNSEDVEEPPRKKKKKEKRLQLSKDIKNGQESCDKCENDANPTDNYHIKKTKKDKTSVEQNHTQLLLENSIRKKRKSKRRDNPGERKICES